MLKNVVVFLFCQFLLCQSVFADVSPDVAAIVKASADAVVAVTVTQNPAGTAEFSFNSRRAEQPQALGSGFIISDDGYIVTNSHVVQGGDLLKVKFKNLHELTAILVGVDIANDIALLKVNSFGLPKVKIGSSAELEIGQSVIAIGWPLGLGQSVTTGIVSAKDRVVPDKGAVAFIQTDAVLNEGNSGGPLFDGQGTVVGVNSWIYSHSGRYEGMSFAIPIDLVMNVVEQLKKTPRGGAHGWMGIKTENASTSSPKSYGALILSFAPASPAQDAGLRAGDIVVAFNQQIVENSADLSSKVKGTPADTWVDLDIIREGERRVIKVKTGRDKKAGYKKY